MSEVEFLLPRGFEAAGTACGIKENAETPDLALFVSARPSTACGVFTQNKVCGAPVKVSRERVPSEHVRAVVINSGNANACTGDRGITDAEWMTARIAERLGCDAAAVLVCSTGIIGRFLPRPALEKGIPLVADGLTGDSVGYRAAAIAMMTTDTVPKQSVRDVMVGGQPVRISGAAKGAAMIGPNMATMLAVLMTDADLAPNQADEMLRRCVDGSFNSISVDGHTSTSDTVLLLANGAAGAARPDEDDACLIEQAIAEVCEELAQAIIRDAEGADHFVTIEVTGLRDQQQAREIAKTVADDALTKAAIAGADPNWGRIVSACGRTSVSLTEEDISLRINGTLIYERGKPVEYDESEVSSAMRNNRDVGIEIILPFGDASARFWTSDLTQEYVRLNSEYTT